MITKQLLDTKHQTKDFLCLTLLNYLYLFFIYHVNLKTELLAQFPSSNDGKATYEKMIKEKNLPKIKI